MYLVFPGPLGKRGVIFVWWGPSKFLLGKGISLGHWAGQLESAGQMFKPPMKRT